MNSTTNEILPEGYKMTELGPAGRMGGSEIGRSG